MPIQIVRNDITKMNVDAIVNAANNQLRPGGGVCGAIHMAAGPQLAAECKLLGGCATGAAKATFAYQLPCKYVIHTVGPVWHGGTNSEQELLTSCYKESLKLAQEKGCESIAFPLISSGIFGYPKKEALKVAMDAISDFLMENDMMVYLAVFDKAALYVGQSLFAGIQEYIDQNYVDYSEKQFAYGRTLAREEVAMAEDYVAQPVPAMPICEKAAPYAADESIDRWLDTIDESFSEMLLRKIEEKGMKPAECYNAANVDKKLFSKIKNNQSYKPKKTTALGFAIALKLSLEETRELLMKAGMALSRSSKFDLIVEYCIVRKIYDMDVINQILYDYDQPQLGSLTE